MAKKKFKRKCYFCGEQKKLVRYRPEELEGRFTYACEDCTYEARFGKFGYENKRFRYSFW